MNSGCKGGASGRFSPHKGMASDKRTSTPTVRRRADMVHLAVVGPRKPESAYDERRRQARSAYSGGDAGLGVQLGPLPEPVGRLVPLLGGAVRRRHRLAAG